MDKIKIFNRIESLEATARLMIEECHKAKKVLGGADRPAPRKGKSLEAKKIERKLRLQKRA